MSAEGLDHVGIAGVDLATLAATYEKLGFTLTPMARHSGRRTPGGPVEKYGTGIRCAILRHGYLELISIVDPAAWTHGLDMFLARRQGLYILAVAMLDPEAELARLRRAGVDLAGVGHLERPVDDADPEGPHARFSLLALSESPEGRLQLIRHETPEAIWQQRFLDHPNHAVALDSVTITSAEPAESAARLSRLTGCPATPDPEGGLRVAMPSGLVRLVPGAGAPVISGVTLRTDDGNAAVADLLRVHAVPHVRRQEGVLVPPAAAGGAALLFAPG